MIYETYEETRKKITKIHIRLMSSNCGFKFFFMFSGSLQQNEKKSHRFARLQSIVKIFHVVAMESYSLPYMRRVEYDNEKK